MGNAAKVLIAEQDQSVIRLLKTVLTNAGHRVVLAKDGDKALQSVDEYEIDLALIDAELKGSRGIDLARKIKKDHPDVSVAFLCYFGSSRSAIAAADAGVDRYILKPFDDLAAVNRTIKEILAEHRDRLRRASQAASGDGKAEGEAAGNEEPEPTVRVVVADSSKEDRELMGKALEKLRCDVTYATCAQEALLHLSTDEHDVLVVAYDMGDMTADDVLLRARRFDELVSVVVTSPSPTLAQTTSLIKKGASGFVEKPLKDPERTAESIVRRGLAVLQLREERAAGEAEEDEGQAEPADEDEADEGAGDTDAAPRDDFKMTDEEDEAAEGGDADDEEPGEEDAPPDEDQDADAGDDEAEPPEDDDEEDGGDESGDDVEDGDEGSDEDAEGDDDDEDSDGDEEADEEEEKDEEEPSEEDEDRS
jgi:DNA-binding NtrC family response regulator